MKGKFHTFVFLPWNPLLEFCPCSLKFFFFFLSRSTVNWILVSQPGTEPAPPPPVEVWSLNHGTAREVPLLNSLNYKFYLTCSLSLFFPIASPEFLL